MTLLANPAHLISPCYEFSAEQARFNMIEQQIRPWGVLDPKVLNLLRHVKRELFVPHYSQSLAFIDTQLPLGQGQFMLSPKLEARLLQAANPSASERVLEVGTGSGYMAALLGFAAAQVVTFETVHSLITPAHYALKQALLDNVNVEQGCGFQGAIKQAGERGWDLIMLSGSVPSLNSLSQDFLNTLSIKGRLVTVVGDVNHSPMMQAVRVTRNSETVFVNEILFECDAPALNGLLSTVFVF
jgi:protein-L-isoaspartate(D-aspartate) O-methyltransferase